MAFLAHCSAPTEPTGETVAGRAPPGHSNRADRRENQGLCAKLQFIGKLLTFLLSWSFFILHSTPYPESGPAENSCFRQGRFLL